jgi:NADH-quinone oxidoreductase subunit E
LFINVFGLKMENSNNIQFDTETLNLVEKIIARYPEGKQKSALLPILHIAQAEFDGWLSVPVMDYVASLLKIQAIEVYEVATFYSMYNLKPVGKCVIEVCHTAPCMLKGAGDIITYFEKKLGIKVGETTSDGKFSLHAVECLAACGSAPVVKVGTTYLENVTCEKVDELITDYQDGEKTTHQNPYKA